MVCDEEKEHGKACRLEEGLTCLTPRKIGDRCLCVEMVVVKDNGLMELYIFIFVRHDFHIQLHSCESTYRRLKRQAERFRSVSRHVALVDS